MEVVRWVFSAIVALTVTLIGTGLAIGAVIFATVVKLIAVFGFIAAALAVTLKEKMDERNNQDK